LAYRHDFNGESLSCTYAVGKCYTFLSAKKETFPFLIEWNQPENERIDRRVVNDQSITALHFGGIKKSKFAHIYQLNQAANTITLQNTSIVFTNGSGIIFNIV